MKKISFLFTATLLVASMVFFSCQKDDAFVNTPPEIEDQQFSINENSTNSTLVGNVEATDSDKDQTLKYYIISGNLDNAFKIDSLTGAILVNDSLALDYEKYSLYELGVKVVDSYKENLSTCAKITINIYDVYENNKPHICDQNFIVDENKPNGTIVGNVIATDDDLSQTLTYSIISDNLNDAFIINPSTGIITVNNYTVLDYEALQFIELQVKVQDSYAISLSDTAVITINILDIEEISIPQDGLVAYYPFNGNANDESGSAHNGTVYGATLSTDRHHKASSAYEFDGINDYINTLTTFDYQYRTISLWVKPYEINGTYLNKGAVLIQDSYENSYGLVTVLFGDGLLAMNAGGASSTDLYLNNSISEDRWYHLVLVRNGAQLLYYINGDLLYSGVSGSLGSTSNPNPLMLFGVGRTTTIQFFSGKIDDVAIYNRALSASEINTIYGVK